MLEVDGDRILEGETLVSHCRAHQRDTHTLGVLRAMPEDEAEAEVPSLAASDPAFTACNSTGRK